MLVYSHISFLIPAKQRYAFRAILTSLKQKTIQLNFKRKCDLPYSVWCRKYWFRHILLKYQSDHTWSKNIPIINPKETDVNDWASTSDATLASDLANINPHPHLSGHQTIQQSFFTESCWEATSLTIIDYLYFKLWIAVEISARVGGTSYTLA